MQEYDPPRNNFLHGGEGGRILKKGAAGTEEERTGGRRGEQEREGSILRCDYNISMVVAGGIACLLTTSSLCLACCIPP